MNSKVLKISIAIVIAILVAVALGFYLVKGGFFAGDSVEGTLDELMTKMYAGISEENLPMLGRTEITSENASYFLGTDTIAFKEAMASEPMMSSVAHSVVLLRVEENANIEEVKTAIKENIDPRKWICVEVEKDNVIVENRGDLIAVIMVNEHRDTLYENFKNL